MKFDKSFSSLTESYLKVPARRLFYPRNLKLSETFVDAFRGEYKRLVDEGHDPKRLMKSFNKALQFHIQLQPYAQLQ